jgi:hypothetical protein
MPARQRILHQCRSYPFRSVFRKGGCRVMVPLRIDLAGTPTAFRSRHELAERGLFHGEPWHDLPPRETPGASHTICAVASGILPGRCDELMVSNSRSA